MCQFLKKGCPFSGNGCTVSEEAICQEAQRRKKLEKELCPIMVKLGYPTIFCNCDVPQLRALIPEGIECSKDNICIVRELVPETGEIISKVGGNVRQITAEDLAKVRIPIVQRLRVV